MKNAISLSLLTAAFAAGSIAFACPGDKHCKGDSCEKKEVQTKETVKSESGTKTQTQTTEKKTDTPSK